MIVWREASGLLPHFFMHVRHVRAYAPAVVDAVYVAASRGCQNADTMSVRYKKYGLSAGRFDCRQAMRCHLPYKRAANIT